MDKLSRISLSILCHLVGEIKNCVVDLFNNSYINREVLVCLNQALDSISFHLDQMLLCTQFGQQFVRMPAFLLVFVLTANSVHQAASEVYIDGSKALKRDVGEGVVYANFAAHKFRSLNLVPLVSTSVKDTRECGKLCVDHSSCFSTNLAAFRDQDGKIICELLPSDKYNNSNKLIDNTTFHHFSIKVRPPANIHVSGLIFAQLIPAR